MDTSATGVYFAPAAHHSKASGHPYGAIKVSKSAQFSFLRISKCGSTSADAYLDLGRWEKADLVRPRNLPCYAFIREPVDRILSSLPETLKRLAVNPSSYGDVEVVDEIENAFLGIEVTSPIKLANELFSLIEHYGAFDAHHEAQYKFLFDFNGYGFANPRLFKFDDFSTKLQAIKRAYHNGGQISSVPEMNSRKLSIVNDSWPSAVIRLNQKHPIARATKSVNGELQIYEVEQFLKEFYENLRNNRQLRSRISSWLSSVAPLDFKIYESLDFDGKLLSQVIKP